MWSIHCTVSENTTCAVETRFNGHFCDIELIIRHTIVDLLPLSLTSLNYATIFSLLTATALQLAYDIILLYSSQATILNKK